MIAEKAKIYKLSQFLNVVFLWKNINPKAKIDKSVSVGSFEWENKKFFKCINPTDRFVTEVPSWVQKQISICFLSFV
jgi:hypothetical protein